MKRKIHLLLAVMLLWPVCAGAQNSSLSQRSKSRIEAIRSSHNDKVEKLKAEHEAFRRDVMERWGEKEMVESTKKVWVEYSDDRNARFRVDFEKGEVIIEILSEKNESRQSIIGRIEKTVESLLDSRGKSIDFKSEVVEQKPVTEKPIMENQINVSKEEISRKSSSYVQKEVATASGQKNVNSVTLQLTANHLPERAARFSPLIKQYSQRFDVDEPLIYAIMEQESAFNPMARSRVAYGLMQLVPSSGGKDAYLYVHKKNTEPSPEFLYNPDNNIRLGTAYIKILMTREFPAIKDRTNRMLCSIAAYNTGSGNVARAFTGNYSVSSAAIKINNMTNEELYNHLKYYLHHPEARDYIQKVTSKMKKYVK